MSQIRGPRHMEPEGPGVVLPLSKVYSHNSMPEELTPEEEQRVLGSEICIWSEFKSIEDHTEYMQYPRVIAIQSWNGVTIQIKNEEIPKRNNL